MFKKVLIAAIVAMSASVSWAAGLQCSATFADPLVLNTKQDVLNWLLRVNPELSIPDLNAKLASTSDTFSFFRSFVANFYDLIKGDPQMMAALDPLLSQTGWMFGDVHFQNAGSEIQQNGDVKVTITDLDDGGNGPLVLDVVRYLTSIKISHSQIDTQKIFQSYIAGLQNIKLKTPSAIKKFASTASNAGKKVDPSQLDGKTGILLRSPTIIDLNFQIAGELDTYLEKTFKKKLKILDRVEILRDKGGSGLLKRYRFLVELKGERVLLEFKQLQDSSIREFEIEAPISNEEKVLIGLQITQGNSRSSLYKVLTFMGADFELRPRFAGDTNFNLDKLDPESQIEVLNYIAWKLGRLHSRTSHDLALYLTGVASAQILIDSISEQLADQFYTIYKLVGN